MIRRVAPAPRPESELRTHDASRSFAAGVLLLLAAGGSAPAAGAAEAVPLAATALPNHWTALGPDGGEVHSLLVHPLEAGVVYAGTSGGVFVSRDVGDTWRPAGAGLSASRVDALAMRARASAPLWAATDHGVFFLPAGGGRWLPASAGLPADQIVGDLELDPADASRLYATVSRDVVSGTHLLYRSTDAGSSWSLANDRTFSQRIAIAPTSPPTLWAASALGAYRSTDGGASFVLSSEGLPIASSFSDLLVHPQTPTVLYAARRPTNTDPSRLFISPDGGANWLPAGLGLPFGFNVSGALAVDPARPETLWFAGDDGLFRSDDGGLTFSPAGPAPAGRRIFAVAVAPPDGTVFAGGARFGPGGAAGVLRSTDGGASWRSLESGLAASSINSLLPHPAERGSLLVGTDSRGGQATGDGGASWTPATAGIPEPWIGPLTRDPSTPATVYAVAGERRLAWTRAYRTTDAGASWQAAGPPMPCCVGPVVVDPVDPAILYLAAADRVLRSLDRGASWHDLTGPICTGATAFGIHPVRHFMLLGCVHDSGAPVTPPVLVAVLYRSGDGGASWQRALEGPHASGSARWTFAFDPAGSGVAYAGVAGFFNQGAIFRTEDGGLSWTLAGPPSRESVQALLVGPANPSHVFAGTARSGVLRSTDGGATWAPFGALLGCPDVRALAFDPTAHETLLAGTGGGGVFALRRGQPLPCSPADDALCLAGGRFRVEAAWRDFQGASGIGRATPLTDSTGVFSFFRPGNLELAVKVLDGAQVNGRFWVFYGGLSNVGYTLTATDTATGLVRHYENPPHRLASAADTGTFTAAGQPAGAAPAAGSAPGGPGPAALPGQGSAGDTALGLHGGRFRVEIAWETPQGDTGAGTGEAFSDDAGTFWFFRPDNREVALKVLDGRLINGHFWVFFGSLSNVGYRVRVTDTETGDFRDYENPAGTLTSRADLAAF